MAARSRATTAPPADGAVRGVPPLTLAPQLCTLVRRTARGGKDSIDHPPMGHNDVANSVAGVLRDGRALMVISTEALAWASAPRWSGVPCGKLRMGPLGVAYLVDSSGDSLAPHDANAAGGIL
jgi:hypothetical protein